MSLWPLKIIIKLLLCWVPHRHKILRKLGIFKHGKMDEAAHALKIFKLHTDRAFPNGLPENFTMLELGPGDSLLSALIAKSYGAGKIYLADEGNYATTDITLYKTAAQELNDKYKLTVPDLRNIETIEDFLKICNAHYITSGLEGLKAIPACSVDFIWSHSVVEHIRKNDFAATMRELARIITQDGIASHIVDLQDHLDKSLNNLRFPECIWENDIFAKAGFYTNRLRYTQSLDLMRRAGFEVISTGTGQWDLVPLPRAKMNAEFRGLSDDELKIRTYSVLLKAA